MGDRGRAEVVGRARLCCRVLFWDSWWVGMPTMAEFFQAIRLTTHVGVSPRSLARIAEQIEALILRYEQTHGAAKATGIQVIAGADETFFDTVILILMDPDSGFILAEEMTKDRTFLTWQDRARQALTRVGVTVRCLVSDQAKALSKLALEELQCRKIPDLFHALHERPARGGQAVWGAVCPQRGQSSTHDHGGAIDDREASPAGQITRPARPARPV